MEENNHILFSNSKILNLRQTNLADRIHAYAVEIGVVLNLVHTKLSFLHLLHVMLAIQTVGPYEDLKSSCIFGISLQITG